MADAVVVEVELQPTTAVTGEKLRAWYESHVSSCKTERDEAYEARDQYDGNQWTEEEKAILRARFQPIITSNRIAPKINFLVGAEIASRIDPVALPRTPNEEQSAELATDALRYASGRDYANFPRVKTNTAEGLFVEGISGALIDQSEDGPEDFTLRHLPYDRIFWDPHSRDVLFRDALYTGLITWLDIEDATEKYGDEHGVLFSWHGGSGSEDHEDAPSDDWYDRDRQRVKIAEFFWWEGPKLWSAHVCSNQIIWGPKLVDLVDDKGRQWCPLVLVRGNCTRKDNASYGMVKPMISSQQEINKRKSRAMFLLQQNRVIAERGAIANPQEFQTELAKPDGFAEVTVPGALQNGAIQILPGTEMANGHIAMLQDAKAEIDQVGPSAPVLAADDSTMSGVALLRKKELANTELRPIYDRLEEWQHAVFCRMWWWIRQRWTAERWIRLTDDESMRALRFVRINGKTTTGARAKDLIGKGMDPAEAFSSVLGEEFLAARLVQEATIAAQNEVMQVVSSQGIDPEQIDPEMQSKIEQTIQSRSIELALRSPLMAQPYTENSLAQVGIDIIIETTPDIAVVQQEQSEMLADMAGKGFFNPAVVPWPIMRMIIKASQLRDKRKMIEDLEKIFAPSPDEGQQQAAQIQSALQLEAMKAQLEKLNAEVEKIKAETAKTIAQIPGEQAATQLDEATAMKKLIDAGKESVPNLPIGGQQMPSRRMQP